MFIRWKKRQARYGQTFAAVLSESYRVAAPDRKVVELLNAGGRVSQHVTQRTPRLRAVLHLGALRREEFMQELVEDQDDTQAEHASSFLYGAARRLYASDLPEIEIRCAIAGLRDGVDRILSLPMSFQVPSREMLAQDDAERAASLAGLAEKLGTIHRAITQ